MRKTGLSPLLEAQIQHLPVFQSLWTGASAISFAEIDGPWQSRELLGLAQICGPMQRIRQHCAPRLFPTLSSELLFTAVMNSACLASQVLPARASVASHGPGLSAVLPFASGKSKLPL
jgi:hypothetical protein